MSYEHPMIDEILFDKDLKRRCMSHDHHAFEENAKNKVPPLHIIEQVFNGINHQYSWIVKVNQ